MLERALGEKEALDVLLDYAADEGDGGRGDQGQRLNEAMTLHEVGVIGKRGNADVARFTRRLT